MTDKVLVLNKKTGAMEVVKLGYYLALYDLGMTVGYLKPDFKGDPKKAAESDHEEGVIVGIESSVATIKGEVISSYIYDLEDGTQLMEEEITHYYPKDTEEEVEEQSST